MKRKALLTEVKMSQLSGIWRDDVPGTRTDSEATRPRQQQGLT